MTEADVKRIHAHHRAAYRSEVIKARVGGVAVIAVTAFWLWIIYRGLVELVR